MLLFTLERTILRNDICLFECFLEYTKIIFACYSLDLVYIFLFYLHTILVSSSNRTSKIKKTITDYELSLFLGVIKLFLLDYWIAILLAALQREWWFTSHEVEVDVEIIERTVKKVSPKNKIIRIANF